MNIDANEPIFVEIDGEEYELDIYDLLEIAEYFGVDLDDLTMWLIEEYIRRRW